MIQRAIFLVCVLLYALSGAVSTPAESVHNIAVLDFDALGNISADHVQIIGDRFQTEILGTKVYKVLERNKIDRILEEQGFQSSGACNSSDCQVEIGQLLGVDKLVVGSIGQLGAVLTINIKIINVNSGEIELSRAVDFRNGVEELLVSGCRLLAEQLADYESRGAWSSTASSNESEGNTATGVDESSESSVGLWVAGGVLVIATTIATYLFFKSDKESAAEQVVVDDVCVGACY